MKHILNTSSTRIATGVVFVAALSFAAVSPAGAAETETTFTLAGGALSISAPGDASLGEAGTGAASVSADLGTVTVTDDRGETLGAYTATVAATDFTTGEATANQTIANGQVTYQSGPIGGAGIAVRLPGQATAEDLSVQRDAAVVTGTVGNNTSTWNPTVTVNLPTSAVAGTYTGTITHSVA